ncbi:MAG: NAD(P)/FAD-dependent oxidoreductase, partial [bacterium]
FDDFLLQRAAGSGARLRLGMRVRDIRQEADAMVVVAGEETFRAPWVLGAGGHHCPVARRFGAIDADEAVVVARESETRVGRERLESLSPHAGTPELITESDFCGYGWYFAKGDFLNIGIGCLSGSRDLNHRCDAMLSRLRTDGRLPADLQLEPFKGHAYAVHIRSPRRKGGPGWMLAGDAAGLARGISGEGIGPAVASAVLAAQLLLEGRAAEYPAALASLCGKGETSRLGQLAGHMPQRLAESIARTICRTPGLRRRLIFEQAFGMGREETR